MALGLVVVLLFVAANFVLVDVRLLGLTVETRLAWAVVVPSALAFVGGATAGSRRRRDRRPGTTGSDEPGLPAERAG